MHVNVSKANQAIIIKQPTAKVRKYYYVSLPEVICNDRWMIFILASTKQSQIRTTCQSIIMILPWPAFSTAFICSPVKATS